MFAIGDVEGDTDNSKQFAFAAVKGLDVGFEDQLLPLEFVGDGLAGQSLAVSGDRSKFRVVGLEIFEKSFAGHRRGMRSEFLQAGAHAGSETQFFIGGPENRRHFFHHDAKAGPALVAIDLGFFKVFEHAVDGGAQEGEFIVAGNGEPREKISTGADLSDALRQVGDAGNDEALEQVQSDRSEYQSRGEQQEQELQLAGAALLGNGTRQKHLNEQRRLAVNVVDALIGGQRVVIERSNRNLIASGNFLIGFLKIGTQRSLVEALPDQAQVSHGAQAREFIGIEQAAHDHSAGDGAATIAHQDGAGVHDGGTGS